MAQKGDFLWVVLFDDATPETFKRKVEAYQSQCPNLMPIWVPAKASWHFIRIFRTIIQRDLQHLAESGRKINQVITCCLDNDDALAKDYIERLSIDAQGVEANTFITYPHGIQYFTSLNIAIKINYPNNHFLAYVEDVKAETTLRTVYGYGDHSYLYQYKGINILPITTPSDRAAWLEVVHGQNISNDVYMRGKTPLVKDREYLRQHFGVDLSLSPKATRIYYSRFMLRKFGQVFRHIFLCLLRYIPSRVFNNRFTVK